MGQASDFLQKDVHFTKNFSLKVWVIGVIILAIFILPNMGISLNPFKALSGGGNSDKTDRVAIRQDAMTDRTDVRQSYKTERTDIRQSARTDRAYDRQQSRQKTIEMLIDAHPFLRRRRRR